MTSQKYEGPSKISHLYFIDCWCQNINTEIISTCPGPLYSMPMYEFLSEDWGFAKLPIKPQ